MSFLKWPLERVLAFAISVAVFAVVAVFGVAVYVLRMQSVYREVEADLFGAAQILVSSSTSNLLPNDRSDTLPEVYLHRFGMAPRDRAYMVEWDKFKKEIGRTGEVPSILPPDRKSPGKGPRPFLTRSSGRNLEVIVNTPKGGWLLIGRPLAKEFDSLSRLAWTLIAVGLCVALAGCLLGVMMGRFIGTPINQLARQAEQIDARSIARQRLPELGLPLEISQLAGVINRALDSLSTAFLREKQFTSDAAHELRTPISVILALSDHMLTKERTTEQYVDALQTCRDSARQMKVLTEQLLTLTKLDSGTLPNQPVELPLDQLVESVVAELTPLAEKESIQLRCETSPCVIRGYSIELKKAISNLVSNAIKFSHRGGNVRVSLEVEKSWVSLSVLDSGVGISDEDQARIFDRFYQADPSRTVNETRGFGLGLNIVKQVVDLHQGQISVSSKLGDGSCFTLRLPLSRLSSPAA